MKAIVTSIGETTTETCVWALERNGFDVQLIQNAGTSLAEKLKLIYATNDENFIRVDADVIVNQHCTPNSVRALSESSEIWWMQFQTFDWYKQDLTWGGVQFIKKKALPILSENINTALNMERPESQMYRLKEFYEPRRCVGVEVCMGIHGYGIHNVDRVKETKKRRNQYSDYDFELAERLSNLK
jgi:hypothetical protein